MTRTLKPLLADPRLASARLQFTRALCASRRWDELVADGIKTYGPRPQGGHVSGIYSEHFPAELQCQLRSLAHECSEFSERAWNCFPPRTRSSTKRNLRLALIERDGKGYYG